MDDPEIYKNNNKFQAKNNEICLMENIDKIKWNKGARILDIGSGDGSFTANKLKNYLPDDFKELIGVDKNEEMVKFANKYYANDNVKFVALEIGSEQPIIEVYNEYFNHIFSFYALQYIWDQRKAFSQIYSLLAKDGNCFFTLVAKAPAFIEVWRIMSKTEKWSRWVKNIDDIVCPYNYSVDPVKEVTDIMSDAGFIDIDVKLKKVLLTFEMEELRLFLQGMSIVNVPEEHFEEYFDDFIKINQDNGYMEKNLDTCHWLIVIYGKKP